jgi:Tfp pilus assembly PilM family ATPase
MIKLKMIKSKATDIRSAVYVCQVTDLYLKVARCQVAAGGAPENFVFDSEAIPAGTDEKKIEERLTFLLSRLGFRNNPLIISLPRAKATCRYVKIPAQSPQEIEKIVTLQASRYLPYPQEELITGYEIISMDKAGYSNVEMVIVHRDMILRYVKIAKSIGARQMTIALSSYGLTNLFNYSNPQHKAVSMLIDVDVSHLELVVIAHGKMVFSRHFKADISSVAGEGVFIDELRRSRDAYVKEVGGELPDQIFITGGEPAASGLVKLLNAKEGLKAEILPSKNTGTESSFSNLLGFGLKETPLQLNLLPYELKEEFKKASRKSEYIRYAVFSLAIIALLCAGAAKSLDNKKQYLEKLKTELDKVSMEAKPLKEIERRLSISSGSMKERPSALDALSEIYRLIPQEISLSELIYETGKEMVIRGQAQALGPVFSLVTKLEKSAVFGKFSVKVRYATNRKTSAGEVIGFEIVCMKK